MDHSARRGDVACENPFLRGSLEVDKGGVMDCIVIALSVNGARVALADVPTLGDHGLLAIPARFFRKACKVVQRGKDDTFRVAFVPIQEASFGYDSETITSAACRPG